MAVAEQVITDKYALYNGDCCEVVLTIPSESVGLSVYSPPFCGLYNYSSDDRDMSNSPTYDAFYDHYRFLVPHIHRITQPGRLSCVHCMDIPNPGQRDGYHDLPGNIIRIHEDAGFYFFGRIAIWKEPLRVAIRTRLKHLTHKQLVKDSTQSTVASGDYLLVFKKRGENKNPVSHGVGFTKYVGGREVPEELLNQKAPAIQQENRLSQWIWRNYASCFWDDIRVDRVLPYKEAKDPEDEKHIHPLQLDVIERCVVMWSNPGDVVFTPFLGVGSEAFGAVANGRKAVGVELKASYFRQAVHNVAMAEAPEDSLRGSLFDFVDSEEDGDTE